MTDDIINSFSRIKERIYDRHRGFEFIDCCQEYRFIREANNISFNNKMNKYGLVPLVMNEDYNFSEVFINDLINPIIYKANFSLGVEGYTRSGKSELVETAVQIIKDANRIYRHRNVELCLCWTQPQFHEILKNLKKGDIVWRDEDPKPTREGSRTQTWEVENVLHAIAKMENTFIFVDPKKVRVDCDLYLQSAGMNRKTRINRFLIKDDERECFGHIYVKLHDNDEFREWYEREKDQFIDDTMEKVGYFKSNLLDNEDENNPENEENNIIRLNNNQILSEALIHFFNGYCNLRQDHDDNNFWIEKNNLLYIINKFLKSLGLLGIPNTTELSKYFNTLKEYEIMTRRKKSKGIYSYYYTGIQFNDKANKKFKIKEMGLNK